MHTCGTQPLLKHELVDEVGRIRARMASPVGGRPSRIAIIKSTSAGLLAVSHALELDGGGNVMVCPDARHAHSRYP